MLWIYTFTKLQTYKMRRKLFRYGECSRAQMKIGEV